MLNPNRKANQSTALGLKSEKASDVMKLPPYVYGQSKRMRHAVTHDITVEQNYELRYCYERTHPVKGVRESAMRYFF